MGSFFRAKPKSSESRPEPEEPAPEVRGRQIKSESRLAPRMEGSIPTPKVVSDYLLGKNQMAETVQPFLDGLAGCFVDGEVWLIDSGSRSFYSKPPAVYQFGQKSKISTIELPQWENTNSLVPLTRTEDGKTVWRRVFAGGESYHLSDQTHFEESTIPTGSANILVTSPGTDPWQEGAGRFEPSLVGPAIDGISPTLGSSSQKCKGSLLRRGTLGKRVVVLLIGPKEISVAMWLLEFDLPIPSSLFENKKLFFTGEVEKVEFAKTAAFHLDALKLSSTKGPYFYPISPEGAWNIKCTTKKGRLEEDWVGGIASPIFNRMKLPLELNFVDGKLCWEHRTVEYGHHEDIYETTSLELRTDTRQGRFHYEYFSNH